MGSMTIKRIILADKINKNNNAKKSLYFFKPTPPDEMLLESGGILLNDLPLNEPKINYNLDLRKQFNSALVEAMQMINTNSHDSNGVYYFTDYIKYCEQNGKTHNPDFVNGYANNEFWDVIGRYTFRIKPNKKPSEAVNAFLNGLTIADCGNVIVACQLAALLKVFGAEKFDAIFNNKIMPLKISQIICDKESCISEYFFDYADKKDIPTKGKIGNRPINEGEMCHFGNVPYYPVKHPMGFSGGFNVICLGKNSKGEDLLLGFSPIFKDKPLTETEIALHFINTYNLDRNDLDKEHIKKCGHPSIYNMKNLNVKEAISIEEGLKDVKGYLAGSVIKPLYDRIYKYQKMDIAEIPNRFAIDYMISLSPYADENEEILPETRKSSLNVFSRLLGHPLFSSYSQKFSAKPPITDMEIENIEKPKIHM